MKALKGLLIACSLIAVAAHAQTEAPATNTQQVAQSNTQRTSGLSWKHRFAAPSRKKDECVGPAGFCNIFFGS